eukprot:131874-Pyramimonas_sp.AAC.1
MNGPRLSQVQARLFPGNSCRVPATHTQFDRRIPALRGACQSSQGPARRSGEEWSKVTIA